jgi:hypothetical protein
MHQVFELYSISHHHDEKSPYHGTNCWLRNNNNNNFILLNEVNNKRTLYIKPYEGLSKDLWTVIPSEIYNIIMGSTSYRQNIPVSIILPNNYKEMINAVFTAHIAEYLLMDVACIAGSFLGKEVDSNIAIEFYEYYI